VHYRGHRCKHQAARGHKGELIDGFAFFVFKCGLIDCVKQRAKKKARTKRAK
jgi:hypothetical protein